MIYFNNKISVTISLIKLGLKLDVDCIYLFIYPFIWNDKIKFKKYQILVSGTIQD